ncbi:MAG: glycosyltransferase [Actinomycetota bacterium]
MKKVSFSIITPTYNRLKSGYLEKCIKSVQQQSGDNFTFQHIIIDDASTDMTSDYLNKAKGKYLNLITITNKTNKGTGCNYKIGLASATNDYVIFMDDDDMLPPNSLKTRAKYITENPDVDWFYGKAKWINETGKFIPVTYQSKFPDDHFYERLIIKNFIHNGTPTISRKALEDITWPSWLDRTQDYFLWLELSKPEKKLNVGFIDDYIFTYRVHQNAYTYRWERNHELTKYKDESHVKIKKTLHSDSLSFFATTIKEYMDEIKKLKKENIKLKEKLKTKTKSQ